MPAVCVRCQRQQMPSAQSTARPPTPDAHPAHATARTYLVHGKSKVHSNGGHKSNRCVPALQNGPLEQYQERREDYFQKRQETSARRCALTI